MEVDADKLMERFMPIVENLLGAYPEPLQGTFKEMMRVYEDVLPLIGDAFAVTGDLSDDGMQFVYYFDADDPELLISNMVEAMSSASLEGAGFSYSAPELSTVEGVEVTAVTMSFDWQRMAQMISDGLESALSEEEKTEMQEDMRLMMETFYGKEGMRMRLAASEERVAMLIGGDQAWSESALSGLGGGSTRIPEDLEEALDKVDAAGCGMVVRYDFGDVMNQMSDLMMDSWRQLSSVTGEEERPFPELPSVPITWFGTVEGTLWTSSVELDLAAFRRLVDVMGGG
jgi:hypothetical protein